VNRDAVSNDQAAQRHDALTVARAGTRFRLMRKLLAVVV
jgi:hypothetical protein